MRILISGICGFVGAQIAEQLIQDARIDSIVGMDNLARRGSWLNLQRLQDLGIEVSHGDVRCTSDIEMLPDVDWVVDAAATPSVLSGVNESTSSRQLVETNLIGTVNLLEYCKLRKAGFILLSTSRVYSIPEMAAIPLQIVSNAFEVDMTAQLPDGLTRLGITEKFSTAAPVSLYGATKLASEALAQEYSCAFGIPLWINRCGVLAGAGQFGKADQGIFAFWLHSWREKTNLRYIGFEGNGYQVRDCLHPSDLANLITLQVTSAGRGDRPITVNVAGGTNSAMSLANLSWWCEQRWGKHAVSRDLDRRPYDLPWVALDHTLASQVWDWKPTIGIDHILTEIADHADANPDWLKMSS